MSLLFEFSLEPIVTYCVLIDGLNKIFELCSFLFGGKQKFAFEKTHTLTMCTCICMYMVYINKHAFVPRVVYWTDKFRQYNKAYLALRSRPLILFPSKRTWGFLKFFFFFRFVAGWVQNVHEVFFNNRNKRMLRNDGYLLHRGRS